MANKTARQHLSCPPASPAKTLSNRVQTEVLSPVQTGSVGAASLAERPRAPVYRHEGLIHPENAAARFISRVCYS